ncbi:MAG: FRG domain-containing protein [Thermoleophilia bacterium]
MGKYVITKIEDLVTVGKTLAYSWFRGNSKISHELTPRLFRKEFFKEFALRPKLELTFIMEFKRIAPQFKKDLPEEDDFISWLFLMQHYGTPTRLLDWTNNPMIGLYFAVRSNLEDDGVLYSLGPEGLNRLSGIDGIPILSHPKIHPIVEYYIQEPFVDDSEKLIEELQMSKIPDKPIAIDPPMIFRRMYAQQSTFTIHSGQQWDSFQELLPHKKDFVQYTIPAANKKQLLRDVAALGITHRTIFPDLEAHSRSIIYGIDRMVKPEPPTFS